MWLSNRSTLLTAIVLFLGIALANADQYDQYFHGREVVEEYYLAAWNYRQDFPISHVYVGKQEDVSSIYDYESFRTRFRWNVSSIPDNATINSARLYITSIATSNKPNADFVRFFVRSSSNSDWGLFNGTAFNNMAGGTQYSQLDQPTGAHQTYHVDYSAGSDFCTDIGSSLSSNYFQIALRADDDNSWGTGYGTVHSIDLKNSDGTIVNTVRLVINYTVPVVNYNITVQNDLPNNGGIIEVDYASLSSPVARTWGPGSSHEAAAIDQDYQNYFRLFRNLWTRQGTTYNTARQIGLTADASVTYEAKFRRRFDVGMTVASYTEPGSGGTYKVNGTNVGSTWQGTFLEFDPTPITLEAVPPGGDWFFVQWSDGNLSNPRQLVPSDHTTLYAIFKMHLYSSSSYATGSNSQRVVSGGHMVYESGGYIWQTSGGSAETMVTITPASAPSVALHGSSNLCTVYLNNSNGKVMFKDAISPYEEQTISYWEASGRPVVACYASNTVIALWPGQEGAIWCNVGYYSGSIVEWNGNYILYAFGFGNPSIAGCSDNFFVTYDNGSSVFAFDNTGALQEAVPASVGPTSYGSQVCGTDAPEAHVVWQANGSQERGQSVMYQRWYGKWDAAHEFRSGTPSINFSNPTVASNGSPVWAWDDGGNTYKAVYNGAFWTVSEVYPSMSNPSLPVDGASFVATGTSGPPYPLMFGGLASGPGGAAPASIIPEQYSRRVVVARRPSHKVRGLHRSHSMDSGSTEEGDSEPDSSAFFSVEVSSISLKMRDGSVVPVDFSPADSGSDEQSVWSSLTSIPITLASNIDSIFVDGKSEAEGLSRFGTSEIGLSYEVVDADRGTRLRRLNTERVYNTNGVRRLGFRDCLTGLTGRRIMVRPSVRGFNGNPHKLVSTVVHVHTLLNGSVNASGSMLAKKGSEPTLSLPTSFALHQNYPNPFNPTTEIRYEMPDMGYVSLRVYDVLGREVANLADGDRDAGYHTATWNASGEASGVYFARFSVINSEGKIAYSKLNKLVLMK